MIGIIDQVINSYSMIERLKESFPNISIYVYIENNIEKGIETLIKKKCNIIILSNELEISNYQEKYPKIFFLTPKTIKIDGYLLSDDELLKAINQGQEVKVKALLEKKKIKEDNIILNHPKLQWIKHIIQEVYPKKNIVDNLDNLIQNIKEKENLLQLTNKPEINIIKERE